MAARVQGIVPPMLAKGTIWHNCDHGSYVHWIKPNGDALRKCHLQWSLDSNNGHNTSCSRHREFSEIPEKTSIKIYSTVDACHDSSRKCGSSSRDSSCKATRYKGKEIAKPITPPSESASEEDSDPEQAQKDKDMQKNLALIAKYFKKLYKPTTTPQNFLKHRNKNGGYYSKSGYSALTARNLVIMLGMQKECQKGGLDVRDSTYHKENKKEFVLLCKQAEEGVHFKQSNLMAM
ncbi:hypothetical protein Tco_0771104 [Tanacetum coccineum]|uniref:Uncharacterized protein n=1 Tax=Tanacetum coccineum TaxID=301880 RepID=A0ABQ4ZE11_9ASTR